VKKYLNKISGPLLDRIDLHVEVTPVSIERLTSFDDLPQKSSEEIRMDVIQARMIQESRFESTDGIFCNAMMPGQLVREVCKIDQPGLVLLKTAMNKLQLSARAYDRILKVSRTIADLAGSDAIKIEHLAEAIHFRSLDRESWAE
jgi:magnesium chelatase family protein